jgi:hypothetical protein
MIAEILEGKMLEGKMLEGKMLEGKMLLPTNVHTQLIHFNTESSRIPLRKS